jgi:hypothetical protein
MPIAHRIMQILAERNGRSKVLEEADDPDQRLGDQDAGLPSTRPASEMA